MSTDPVTIPKHPDLPAAQDYHRLRSEAIATIEKLGSAYWTDYNTHDPGITLLEALLYSITDLGWRAGWDIADLLRGAADQPFFTARSILTVNPVTPDDYRRLFIDLDAVRNAWVTCTECMCDSGAARVRGLYDVWVELEADDLAGDLNDGLIEQELRVTSGADQYDITVECRFPEWRLADQDAYDAFRAFPAAPFSIACTRFMRAKTGASSGNAIIDDDELRAHWRDVFYASLQVTDGLASVLIPDVSVRFFGGVEGKLATTVADVTALLENGDALGPVGLYHRKVNLAAAALETARETYHAHRNLDEDLCRLDAIRVEQVAVCADVNVAPDADIERVQAEIWFGIENYLAPSIPFSSLSEMLSAGVPVEDIFNGPVLDNGFITQADLDAAQLRSVVRGSDIVNLVMDIPGVVSISKLRLTKYDGDGNPVRGAADPVFVDGATVFDPDRLSASWLLYLSDARQPRLYINLSTFTFSKNGLPFVVEHDEARDTLTQLRGAAERPKQPDATNDIDVPQGVARNAADISPVQYLLPQTYGVGPEGLPGHAGALRHAQARQLKAYLLVFEQILANAFQQLASVGQLFSLSPSVQATAFAYEFSDERLDGYSDVTAGLTTDVLAQLTESRAEFVDRRNLFLDHLLARFGVDVSAHALLCAGWNGDARDREQRIADKLGLLKAIPEISSGRARAFNHRHEPTMPSNHAVLKRRVALLLGFADLSFEWMYDESIPLVVKITSYTLVDGVGVMWVEGAREFTGGTREEVTRHAVDTLLQRLSLPSAYVLYSAATGYRLEIQDEAAVTLATAREEFRTVSDAEEFAEELVAHSAAARAIVVEHLLLRPKFPGDAEYRECADCDGADPWSFRLTVVMPGWTAPYSTNLDLRDFANRTIQEEIPSHLLGKICWVGNDGDEAIASDSDSTVLAGRQFDRFESAWYAWLQADAPFDWGEERLVERVQAMLDTRRTSAAPVDLCACAESLVNAFGAAFNAWMTSNVQSGAPLSAFPAFVAPALTLCPAAEFLPGTESAIEDFLEARYLAFIDVSYRLTVLVRLLESLTNTYPAATLHDCAEGGDVNPVRLNRTSLGALSHGTGDDLHLTPIPDPAVPSGSGKRTRKRKT